MTVTRTIDVCSGRITLAISGELSLVIITIAVTEMPAAPAFRPGDDIFWGLRNVHIPSFSPEEFFKRSGFIKHYQKERDTGYRVAAVVSQEG